MSGRDRTIALLLVVGITIMGFVGYGLLDYDAAGGLNCEAPLRGADPEETLTEGYLVNREEQACDDASGSRLTVAGIVAILYLTIGIGSVVLPESGLERVVFGREDPEEVFTGD